MTPARPLAERLLARIEVRGPDECWPWLGAVNKDSGYGRIHLEGRKVEYVHRAMFVLTYGPIPEGKQIDHLCHGEGCPPGICEHRRCANPAHLRAVTLVENAARGNDPRRVAHREDRCLRGHPRSESSLRVGTNRVSHCRACRREAAAALRVAA